MKLHFIVFSLLVLGNNVFAQENIKNNKEDAVADYISRYEKAYDLCRSDIKNKKNLTEKNIATLKKIPKSHLGKYLIYKDQLAHIRCIEDKANRPLSYIFQLYLSDELSPNSKKILGDFLRLTSYRLDDEILSNYDEIDEKIKTDADLNLYLSTPFDIFFVHRKINSN